jgi:hypothetical protein
MSWLKRIALWFSPRDRFIAQQQALGKTPEEIDIQLRLHDARQWLDTRRRELYEQENPPPKLRLVDVTPSALDDEMPRTELNIFEHRREMEEYEAGYQAVLADEHEELQRELAEEEASQQRSSQRPGS